MTRRFSVGRAATCVTLMCLLATGIACEERTRPSTVTRPSEDAKVTVQPAGEQASPSERTDAGATKAFIDSADAGGFGSEAPQSSADAAAVAPAEVPGWPAFATVPNAGSETLEWWTPSHATAELVLPADAFSGRPGSAFVALSPEGQTKVTYTGASDVPYGCEENRARFARFDAPRRFSEGVVWLLPPGAAAGARVLPIEAGKPRAGGRTPSRSWKVGGLELTALRQAPLKGVLTVTQDGRQVQEVPFEKAQMEGAEKEPVDLTDEGEIAVPFPRWAFELGERGTKIVVLAQRGYEGQTFSLLIVGPDGKVTLQEHAYALYYCAF